MRDHYSTTKASCSWMAVLGLVMTLGVAATSILEAGTRDQSKSDVARGLISSISRFEDGDYDGVPELLEYYEESIYDNQGNRILLVEHTYDKYFDRWKEETTTSTYDSASNLLHEVKDSGPHVVKRWLDYDDRGNLIQELIETHNLPELTYVDLKTYRYDEQGNLVEEIHDRDGQRPESDTLQRWTFTYNERGDRLEEVYERDNGKDGVDWWERYSFAYNERGDLLESIRRSHFSYGTTVSMTRYKYDTTGKLQEQHYQYFDADSQLAGDSLWEYTYEPTGRQVDVYLISTSSFVPGPPSVYERWTTTRYDSRGNQVEWQANEKNGDSCYQLISSAQLDPQGRVLESMFIVTDISCDGHVRGTSSWVTTHAYDRWGNLVKTTWRSLRDGNLRRITTHVYEY